MQQAKAVPKKYYIIAVSDYNKIQTSFQSISRRIDGTSKRAYQTI